MTKISKLFGKLKRVFIKRDLFSQTEFAFLNFSSQWSLAGHNRGYNKHAIYPMFHSGRCQVIKIFLVPYFPISNNFEALQYELET